MLDWTNIKSLGSWAGFLGTLSIIGGVLFCITIVGVLQGVFMILLGIKLRNARKHSAELAATQDPAADTGRLNMLLYELGGFFKLNGILIIIALVLGVVGVVVTIATGSFISSLFNDLQGSFYY